VIGCIYRVSENEASHAVRIRLQGCMKGRISGIESTPGPAGEKVVSSEAAERRAGAEL